MVLDLKCIKCKANVPVGGFNLCQSCKDSDNSLHLLEDQVLVNELLMYVNNMLDCSSRVKLVEVILTFYSEEEVKEARATLMNLGLNMARRTSVKLMAEDIFDLLKKLADEPDPAMPRYIFLAMNWSRVPKSRPETVCNVAMSDEIATLKSQVQMLAAAQRNFANAADVNAISLQVADIVVDCSNNKLGLSNLQETVSEHIAKSDGLVNNVCDKVLYVEELNVKSPSYAGAASMPKVSLSGQQLPQDNLISNHVQIIPQPRTVSQNISPQNHSVNNLESVTANDGFIRPRHDIRKENRQNKRAAVTVGTNQISSGMRSVSKPRDSRDLFLYRVHKEDDIDTIRNHLNANSITDYELVQKNGDGSFFNSFKLTVPYKFAKFVNTPAFWPEGVCVRNWREPSLQPSSDDNSDLNVVAASAESNSELHSLNNGSQ